VVSHGFAKTKDEFDYSKCMASRALMACLSSVSGFESNLQTYSISTIDVSSWNFNKNSESHNEFSTRCGSKYPLRVNENDVSC